MIYINLIRSVRGVNQVGVEDKGIKTRIFLALGLMVFLLAGFSQVSSHGVRLALDILPGSLVSAFSGEEGISVMGEAPVEPVDAAISAGGHHVVALKEDGTAWAWGRNNFGQLGDGTLSGSQVPVLVPGLVHTRSLAAGGVHTLALGGDGTVWSWGRNDFGQVGDGTSTNRLEPVQVKKGASPGTGDYLQGVKVVAAGFFHSVALRVDKSVWTWGNNSYGQLGDDTRVSRNAPVRPMLANIKQVTAGYAHTAALREDGKVFTWGSNEHGQLGDGTAEDRSRPVEVKDISQVQMVTAGNWHTVALKEDGTVWAWGNNDYGQLGIGDEEKSGSIQPVQVPGLENIIRVSAGSWHTVALSREGRVYAWGYNGDGQLGDGTLSNRFAPVQVLKGDSTAGDDYLQGVKDISSGGLFTVVIKEDGTAWAWGNNTRGQLGNGTTESRREPVKCLTQLFDFLPIDFLSPYPFVLGVSDSSVRLMVKINKPGTLYYVILESGAKPPDSGQVISGEDGDGQPVGSHLQGQVSLAANEEVSINVIGLEPDTPYDIYLVAKDLGEKYQPEPLKRSFFTTDVDYLKVISTDPIDMEEDVTLEPVVTIIFNYNIEKGDLFEEITIEEKDSQEMVESMVEEIYLNRLTLKPGRLDYNKVYKVIIPVGSIVVADEENNDNDNNDDDNGVITLENEYQFSFTTSNYLTILYEDGIIPADGKTEVPVDSDIKVIYAENIYAGPEFEKISLVDSYGTNFSIEVYIDGDTLYIIPKQALASHTVYTVSVPRKAVKGFNDNYMLVYIQFGFTTRAEVDTVPPRVISTDPDEAINWHIPVYAPFIATFSETIQPGPYFGDIIIRSPGGQVVKITRQIIQGDTLILQPEERLGYGRTYTVLIPPGSVKDLAGNLLIQSYSYTLETRVLGIEKHEPAAGAKGVSVNQVTTITFNRGVVKGPDFENIRLKNLDDDDVVSIITSIVGKKLYLETEDEMRQDKLYEVYIPERAVKIVESGSYLIYDPDLERWILREVEGDIFLKESLTFQFTTAEDYDIILEIKDAFGFPGDELNIPIIISNSSPFAAFQFDIFYDPSILSPADTPVSKGTMISDDSNWLISTYVSFDDQGHQFLRLLGFNTQAKELRQASGELLKFHFTVQSDVGDHAQKTELRFAEAEEILFLDKEGKELTGIKGPEAPIKIITKNGSIDINTIIDGDVNGDGVVNILDVVLAVNIALGKIVPTERQIKAATFATGNGEINIIHIMAILQLALKN